MRSFLQRRFKPIAISILLALSVLDHLGARGRQTDDNTIFDGAVANVTRVLDGDTLEIDLPDGGAPVTRIRLRGIDAPEIARAEDETDAPFGREAAELVEEHTLGESVVIRLDPNHADRDNAGRLLAYVYLEKTGEMLNESLLIEGFAYADPRIRHVMKLRFESLEKKAAKSKAGLWESLTPTDMPRWRQRRNIRE